jgi:hypothetical protein
LGVGGFYKSEIVFQTPTQQQRSPVTQLGIDQQKSTSDAALKVYPTPANDMITIELPQTFQKGASVIEIVSNNGKVVETRTLRASNFTQINVSKLIPGIYLVRVTNNTQSMSRTITIAR